MDAVTLSTSFFVPDTEVIIYAGEGRRGVVVDPLVDGKLLPSTTVGDVVDRATVSGTVRVDYEGTVTL